MKAVNKFKGLIDKKRRTTFSGALGKGIRTIHTAYGTDGTSAPQLHKSRSEDFHDRRIVETALTAEGLHHDIDSPETKKARQPMADRIDSAVTEIHHPNREESQEQHHHKGKKATSDERPDRPELHSDSSGEKVHAHDPLDEMPLYLGIGAGGQEHLDAPPEDVVAESPAAADFNIYDTAYQEEAERIRATKGHTATVYLTRRVDSKKEYRADENMINAPTQSQVEGMPHQGFKGLLDCVREKDREHPLARDIGGTGQTFSDIASRVVENTRAMDKDNGERGAMALENVMHSAIEKRKEMAEKWEERKA